MNVKTYVRPLLCLYLTLIISSNTLKAQALKVGDRLPPELWSLPLQVINHPAGKETITLSEYKDKLIILDFWATWCGSCIKKFPEMGRIQDQYAELLTIVGVTHDPIEKIENFTIRHRSRDTGRYIPPTVVNASQLDKYFNYRMVPQYVWINKDGKITAITDGEELTLDNVAKFTKNEAFEYVLKQDQVDFVSSYPLYVNGNGGELKDKSFHRSLLTGRVEGLGKQLSFPSTDSTKSVTRLRGINCDIANLFTLAYPEAAQFPSSRIVINSKMADKIRFSGKKEDYKLWAENNHLTYELNIPSTPIRKANQYAAQDFERYWGLVASFEEREIECMIITADENISRFYTKGGKPENNLRTSEEDRFMNNYSLQVFTTYLNDSQSRFFYINEAGEHPNLDIRFPENLEESNLLISFMKKQGICIKPVRKKIRVLVIRDKYE